MATKAQQARATTADAYRFMSTIIATGYDTVTMLRRPPADSDLAAIFADVAEVLDHTVKAATKALEGENYHAGLVLARALRELLIDSDLHTDAELIKY